MWTSRRKEVEIFRRMRHPLGQGYPVMIAYSRSALVALGPIEASQRNYTSVYSSEREKSPTDTNTAVVIDTTVTAI